MMGIPISNARTIRPGACRMLAEAGQCMEGDTQRAVDMVNAAADAGAWGIKVQLLRPETIATPNAPKYWDDAHGTTTQRDAFTAAGLIGYDAWEPVRDAARARRIAFVATPFDMDAVDALERLDVDAYKIASGDMLWTGLADRIVDTGRPILLSTGAAWRDEIEDAVEHMLTRDPSIRYRLVVLACSLVYPTPDHAANVGRVGGLRELIAERGWAPIRVGYSDHTTSLLTPYAAAAAGAVIVEKHYTYDVDAPGAVADHAMAVDPAGLTQCVVHAEMGATMHGQSMLVPTDDEQRARVGARRAAYVVRDVRAGDTVHADDVTMLRPCPVDAMPPHVVERFVRLGGRWQVDRRVGDHVRRGDVDA